jgi:hypothetical protein
MSADLTRLVDEAHKTGTISGLPDQRRTDGRCIPSVSGKRMEPVDPASGKDFASVAEGDGGDAEARHRATRI